MNAWKRNVLAVLSFLALGVAPIGVAAPPPTVTSATPASTYQGTAALDVVVTGSNFNRTAKVQYFVSGTTDSGGIAVTKVVYRSSSELVTTVAVASNADLEKFDIVVTLDDGRKGKGTTLFAVKAPPTYPANRAWHAFTSNGVADVPGSRLYMYGGSGSDAKAVPADLWFYRAYYHQWTLVSPSTTTRPGGRQWNGLSCGAGACVMEAGSTGFGLVDETWLFSEATNAWTQARCGKTSPCPTARQMVTMAFDPERGNHLLFGGRGSQSPGLNDTWTFDAATLKWTLRAPALKPAERNRAAAAHVPGIGVVMHGGQDYYGRAPLCDLFVWNGTNWRTIQFDTNQPHPCLHTHSMSWDGQSLVVTGGYVDTSDTPSQALWRFAFAPGGQSGTWSQTALPGTCEAFSGTDVLIHPGAKMAYDIPTATRVWFGGEANIDGAAVRYGNTVECH
jgi:hypothetical protein